MKNLDISNFKFIFILMLFISCKLNKNNLGNTAILENKIGHVKILGEFEKKQFNPYNRYEYIESGCDKWEITAKQIENIFPEMEEHDNNEIPFIKICYFLPCHYYEGKAIYNQEKYTIKVNAGSYITLINEKKMKQFTFVYKEKSDMFLMPCDCCE